MSRLVVFLVVGCSLAWSALASDPVLSFLVDDKTTVTQLVMLDPGTGKWNTIKDVSSIGFPVHGTLKVDWDNKILYTVTMALDPLSFRVYKLDLKGNILGNISVPDDTMIVALELDTQKNALFGVSRDISTSILSMVAIDFERNQIVSRFQLSSSPQTSSPGVSAFIQKTSDFVILTRDANTDAQIFTLINTDTGKSVTAPFDFQGREITQLTYDDYADNFYATSVSTLNATIVVQRIPSVTLQPQRVAVIQFVGNVLDSAYSPVSGFYYFVTETPGGVPNIGWVYTITGSYGLVPVANQAVSIAVPQ
jgi:hypothetical protein